MTRGPGRHSDDRPGTWSFQIIIIIIIIIINKISVLVSTVTEIPLQIVTPLQDQEVMEKQEATFVCEVSKPNQTAKWQRNGVDLVAAVRYEVKVDGTRHILTINDAEKADQAQYTVAFGDLNSTASLSVTGKCHRITHRRLPHLCMMQW